MQNPRFTFCIPNLNKIEYLPACIESVLAQDCENWRCVFVDGYSTDGSWEYMQQFASDPRFLIRRGIKQGMYADWNECLREVKTEYFYILTSDDTCFSSLVSTTICALDQYPDVDACHFQYALIDGNGEITRLYEDITQSDFELYTEVNRFPHRRNGLTEFIMQFAYRAIYRTITSLVFRKNLLKKLKGFKTIYGTAGDHDWTMRMALQTDVLYLPKLLATWRIYDEQATKSVSSFESTSHSLALLLENYDHLLTSEHATRFKESLNKRQLLIENFDCHAMELYKKTFGSKSFNEAAKHLLSSVVNYPFFLPRKILKRLTFNQLFSYPDSSVRVCKIINDYDLEWPPQSIKTDFRVS